MSNNKIKVVWLCHFSDAKTRKVIRFEKLYYRRILKLLLHQEFVYTDYAVWITNAIREFEKFNDIDLTIVFPHAGIKGKTQRFEINGIHYFCFRSENDSFISLLKDKFFRGGICLYRRNRKIIAKEIEKINPDIVHLIGAENPYYSLSILDVDSSKPTIVSLQTLMSDPDFRNNYPIGKDEWKFRSGIEIEIIRKCTYIATPEHRFRDIIKDIILPNANFLNLYLALGQTINTDYVEKEYDFVYFAADISKAADYAIEAFVLAAKLAPGITLNISGYYSKDYKAQIQNRLDQFGLRSSVFFTGSKESHEEVLKQIKKSRFALLPLKIDLISGTIREAMACGIPVVTTITPATPELNERRESVLLSQKGDFQAMADNMLKLLNKSDYANYVMKNALITVKEKYSNETFMREWKDAYYHIEKVVNSSCHTVSI